MEKDSKQVKAIDTPCTRFLEDRYEKKKTHRDAYLFILYKNDKDSDS